MTRWQRPFKQSKEEIRERFSDKSLKLYFLSNVASIGFTIFVSVVIAVVLVLYKEGIWNNLICFYISIGFISARIVIHIADKISTTEYWEKEYKEELYTVNQTKEQLIKAIKIKFAIQLIVASITFVMAFNLIYDFRMWVKIGLTNKWLFEVFFSLAIIMVAVFINGSYVIYHNRFAFRKIETNDPKERKIIKLKKALVIVQGVLLLGIPLAMIGIFAVVYINVDESMFNGYVANVSYSDSPECHNVYSGQGIDDWFGYVFYILFQAPVPAFMIAFMGVASIAIILAQNTQEMSGLTVAVASGVVAVVPMLIVLSAISGSIPPPQELVEVIGLSKAIASFVYGLGLILTYTIMITIMGTFISSSRGLMTTFRT